MNEPRVTLCLPTIGRVSFLSHTIDSIGRQTRTDFEVLVLDNASDRSSAARLTEWAERDPRVRILRSEERVPMFANFNRGVVAASGEYLAFCHDDDVLRPTFVEQHVAFADRHPQVGFSGSNYDFIDEEGRLSDRSRVVRADGVWPGHDYIVKLMRSEYNPLTMQSIFFRTARLRDAGGFDESLSPSFGDYVVLMRVAEKSDVGHLSAPLVEVRRHSQQASASMTLSAGLALSSRILEDYRKEYERRWPGDPARVRAMRDGQRAVRRVAALRGWLGAPSLEEGQACLAQLGQAPLDRALHLALGQIERIGMRPKHRQELARTIFSMKRALRGFAARRESM